MTYEDLLIDILANGNKKSDRTGTGTISQFGAQIRYDLSEGFPLITTKKVFTKGIIHELIWLISGETNIRYLTDNDVHIWDAWADEDGDLGPVYGHQWRNWGGGEFWDYYWDQPETKEGIDQLQNAIDTIKTNPDSRRIIVNSWNVEQIEDMALPPCHMSYQFYVNDGKLSCQLYQRSADMFLGVPFNIASYALLTHMVADVCGLDVGDFIWTGGDCHIYENHIEQAAIQSLREPFEFPKLELTHRDNIDDFRYEDVNIIGYQHHSALKGAVSV